MVRKRHFFTDKKRRREKGIVMIGFTPQIFMKGRLIGLNFLIEGGGIKYISILGRVEVSTPQK